MQQQHSCYKAEALAVAHLRVQQGVGLQQVVQGQLPCTQLSGEVGVCGKCAAYGRANMLFTAHSFSQGSVYFHNELRWM